MKNLKLKVAFAIMIIFCIAFLSLVGYGLITHFWKTILALLAVCLFMSFFWAITYIAQYLGENANDLKKIPDECKRINFFYFRKKKS